MATVSRATKTASSTGDYADDSIIKHDEVNQDFNTLYTLVNGNIDSNNINASANIPDSALATGRDPAGIDDYANDDAEFWTTATPGDSGTSSKPTDLTGELSAIRYQLARQQRHLSNAAYITDSNIEASIEWPEPPINGPNLLPNSGFEDQATAASTVVPAGWTETLTPSFGVEAVPGTPTAGAGKRSLVMTGDIGEGITHTVGGLKPSTKYLIGLETIRTQGEMLMTTAGALSVGNDYQNISLQIDSGNTYVVHNGVVQTDTSGTDIVVSLIFGQNTSDFNIFRVWMHELGESGPIGPPTPYSQTATHNVADPIDGYIGTSVDTWYKEEITELDLVQHIPDAGYRLIYEASIATGSTATTAANDGGLVELLLSIDGGADSVVDGPYVQFNGDAAGSARFFTLRYVLDNPTPGSLYAFTVRAGALANNSTFNNMSINPVLVAEQTVSRSWLRLERL